MGVLFVGILVVLWVYVVVTAMRRRMFWHGTLALLSSGIIVFGSFAGNWCATGTNPNIETSRSGLGFGCLIGMVVFVVVVAAVAIDMARRIGKTPASGPGADGPGAPA